MNHAEITIIKRDGKHEDFSISKIKNAIQKAFVATNRAVDEKEIASLTMCVIDAFTECTLSVEQIQDIVERVLMKDYPDVAKKYIL